MSRVIINSLPFATRLRSAVSAKKLVEHDRMRANKFLAGLSHHRPINAFKRQGPFHATKSGSIDVTDAGVTYTASVGVGNPPTQYDLLIDTGSSNTWLGASKAYKPTSTSKDTGGSVNVSYGSGIVFGEEYTDKVTLSPDLVIQNQSIGVASTAEGFNGVDGILGVGPTDLTEGTVSNVSMVPTVTDNLYSQGVISSNLLGIFYEPSSTKNVTNGELSFGAVDRSKYVGDISYVPITTVSPASQYWGINQSVTYGENTTLLNPTAGIVDTGTTLLLLATEAFQAYQEKTKGVMDQSTGLLKITKEQYKNLENMHFHIGGITYELTPNAQIWPRKLNSTIGGDQNGIYLVTSDSGNPVGSGLDFINGFCWLQRFYSVFDTANGRVGFARTKYTNAVTN